MNKFTRFITAVSVMLLTVFTTLPAQAEQMAKLGSWHVHYMALGTTFLTPDIAKAYNITRSKYNGLINISVLNNQKPHEAQMVDISGKARSLVGHEVDLQFKQITEGKAIYYIAQLDYNHEAIFNFEVTIKKGEQSEVLKFSQTFYTH